MRKVRVPKPFEQRLAECETHLYFLWDARQQYQHDRERYKQVATELRVLVGDHRPARRLLLALMEETEFSYDVQPPDHPPYGPIPMVSWRDDPEYAKHIEELQGAINDEARLLELVEREKARARPVPFAEYIERALAVHIAPYDYSYRDLVLAVSQQLGSSHEDEAVDEPLLRMQRVVIGGSEGHIAPLILFTDLVPHVGAKFVEFAVEKYSYKPRYYRAA